MQVVHEIIIQTKEDLGRAYFLQKDLSNFSKKFRFIVTNEEIMEDEAILYFQSVADYSEIDFEAFYRSEYKDILIFSHNSEIKKFIDANHG